MTDNAIIKPGNLRSGEEGGKNTQICDLFNVSPFNTANKTQSPKHLFLNTKPI